MSQFITTGSERLAKRTAIGGPKTKLHWSQHFGVLGQVCMLESEKATYKLNDCVETSRLVMQSKRVNEKLKIAAPKKRSVSPSAKPVLAKTERSPTRFNAVTNGVRNCIEIAIVMNRTCSMNNDLYACRSLKVKNAENVLDAMPTKKRLSMSERESDIQEYRTFPERRPESTENNVNEVLTPFQAVKGLQRGGPSYWISCQYGYVPQNKEIEMVVRQTGVLPESKHINKMSKITLEVTMSFGKSGKQEKRTVLKKAGVDNSFKSSKLNFSLANEIDLKEAKASFRIYVDKTFSKKVVSSWEQDMSDCTFGQTKSHMTKVEFSE